MRWRGRSTKARGGATHAAAKHSASRAARAQERICFSKAARRCSFSGSVLLGLQSFFARLRTLLASSLTDCAAAHPQFIRCVPHTKHRTPVLCTAGAASVPHRLRDVGKHVPALLRRPQAIIGCCKLPGASLPCSLWRSAHTSPPVKPHWELGATPRLPARVGRGATAGKNVLALRLN